MINYDYDAWAIRTSEGDIIQDWVRYYRSAAIRAAVQHSGYPWRTLRDRYGYRCVKVKIEVVDD